MPDWRRSNDYAFTEGLTRELWAWEFLRRNPEYRKDWRRFRETWRALEADYGSPPNRDFQRWKRDSRAYAPDTACIDFDELGVSCSGEEGKVLIECWMGAKWGFYKFPLDPAQDQPRVPEQLLWREVDPEAVRIGVGDAEYLQGEGTRLALGFDLSLGLREQLHEAKQYLQGEQRRLRREGRLAVSVRESRARWTRCLRLLDGQAAGASKGELAETLLGTESSSQAFEKLSEEAQDLVTGGYRRILLMPEGLRTED